MFFGEGSPLFDIPSEDAKNGGVGEIFFCFLHPLWFGGGPTAAAQSEKAGWPLMAGKFGSLHFLNGLWVGEAPVAGGAEFGGGLGGE